MLPTNQDPSAQQIADPVQPGADPATGSGVNWEARYKGMVPLVDRLTTTNKTLEGQLAEANSRLEQLQAQLSLKDTEKIVAIGERDKTIQSQLEAQAQINSELATLRGLAAKVKVAQRIGDPTLLAIFDTIPAVSDEAVLEQFMRQISDWGAGKAKSRETELLSGVTNIPTAPIVTESLPTTSEGWQAFVNQAELGSQERDKRMNAWRDWGLSQQR